MSARFLRFLSPAEQARAVADEHYVALMGDVLRITESRLSRRHIDLDRKDVEAAYNQAWHGVCQRIARGEGVENLTGLLVDITYKRSLDIYRQCHEAMHTDDGLEGVDGLESRATSGDLAEQADDRGKLMGLFERLKGRLNTNERKAITLCILHGYSRAEAAKVLGIPEPTFQRIIDAAWKKVASVATGLDGRGCGDDEWARALRSFALGLIDEDHRDYHRISEHVQKCESCRRYVQGLRGLSAVMPPLGLRFIPFAHHHPGLVHTAIRSIRQLLGAGHDGAAGGRAGASTAGGVAAGVGTVKVAAVVLGLAVVGVSIKIATSGHHTTHHHYAQRPPATLATPPAVNALAAARSAPKPAAAINPRRRPAHGHTPVHQTPTYRPPARPAPPPKSVAPPSQAPKPATTASHESEREFSFEQK